MAGVFDGIKVLELGAGAAGPVATRYLGDHGATVIRVESSKRPDFIRTLTITPDSKFGVDGSPMFILLNPNKQSVSINMSEAEGIEIVKRLIQWADVVSENFSPKAMAKWGLEYENLRQLKPELIVISSCLFGQTGPQRMYPGFGGQGSALSGFNHMTGWSDREAMGPHGTITDSLSPKYVAFLITAALMHRDRTGEGQYLDVSQVETGVYSLSEMIVRCSANDEVMQRMGNRSDFAAPHGIYPCRGEDRWIAIEVFSDDEWCAVRREMGEPEWAADERLETAEGRLTDADRLDEELAAWTCEQDAYALMARLQKAGVGAGVVQNFDDLNHDPQLAAREHFVELDHVHLGSMRFEHYGVHLSECERNLSSPGPNLGEHNDYVLGELLGYDRAELAHLVEREIIA